MALSDIECPEMHWDGDNLKENRRRGVARGAHVLRSAQITPRSREMSYLLIWVGQKGRDIYNTWTDITDEDKSKLKTYYDRFEAHVSPRANPVFARFKFHSRFQG